MKSSYAHRVRYSEVGGDRNLKLKAAVDYLQDSTTFQSEDNGEGIEYLNEQGLAWLLASWQIEVLRMPRANEEIVVSTWPHKMKGFFAYRCHAIESPEGEVLVRANSIWFMMDKNTLHPVKIGQDQLDRYTPEERLDMPFAPRRVKIPKEGQTMPSFTPAKHQIDMHGHINNSQYIQIAEEYLPEEFSFTGRVRVEYVNGARLGDTIVPKVCRTEDAVTVALLQPDGKTYAAVEFK